MQSYHLWESQGILLPVWLEFKEDNFGRKMIIFINEAVAVLQNATDTKAPGLATEDGGTSHQFLKFDSALGLSVFCLLHDIFDRYINSTVILLWILSS